MADREGLAYDKAVAGNAELRLAAPSTAMRHVLLAEVEQMYETWVTAFSESAGFGPALVVPDPARPAPGAFRIFASGSALLYFADGLNGFCSSWPEGLGDEHAELISAFFGTLRDWITPSGDQNSGQAEADVSQALDELMKELAKGGFVVGARERFLLLTGGIDAEPLSWRIVDIKVQSAALIRSCL